MTYRVVTAIIAAARQSGSYMVKSFWRIGEEVYWARDSRGI